MRIVLPDAVKEKIAREMSSKIVTAFRNAGLSTIVRAAEVMRTELIPQNLPRQPVDRGIYQAGWRLDTGAMPKEVSLVNTVLYAPIIEYGARAANIKVGKKMLDALTEWVVRKGIVRTKIKTGGGGRKSKSHAEAKKASLIDKSNELMNLLSMLEGEVKQKRIDAPTVKNEKGQHSIKAVSNAEARQTAWAIAMSMKKHGIFNQGKGYRLAEQLAKRLPAMFRVELRDELNQ